MSNLITKELLREWGARESGIEKFIEKYPNGATLKTVLDDWTKENDSNIGWLFDRCRKEKHDELLTIKGDRNSGDRNSGGRNSGDRNSGDWNSGDRNSGDRNSGDWNSGDRNSGDRNSGDRNSGYRNSGGRNSGDRNSGYWNSGNRNSGNWNSGDRNSGGWNRCDRESGFFNSIESETIRVFNKDASRKDWEEAEKPDFIYRIEVSYWVNESDMTDKDKAEDPNFYVRGGQLRKRTYKEAWAIAYESASDRDIELLKNLPNFDAEVFEEITGIKL